MELQPSFSVSSLSGQRAAGDGAPDADRLTEATLLVRRTRLRLEELANRLSEIRERVQKAAEPGPRQEPTGVSDPSGAGPGARGSSGQLG
jgi:hypothetical protein